MSIAVSMAITTAVAIASPVTVVLPSRDDDHRRWIDVGARGGDDERRFSGNDDAARQTDSGKKSKDKSFHGVLRQAIPA